MTREELRPILLNLVSTRGPIRNNDLQVAIPGMLVYGGYSRDLDATLQALRRDGEIVPTGKGWVRADRRPCSRCKGTGHEPRKGR